MKRPAGFSLLEVLFAIALFVGGIAATGQLAGIAARANQSARATTVSVMLACQKMEQLRADMPRLVPGGAMERDVDGFVDYFDPYGRPLTSSSESGFLRRWVVELPPFDSSDSRVLRVRVFRVSHGVSRVPPWPGPGLDESRLLTVVTEHDR